MANAAQNREVIRDFISNLERLDAGGRARLKRNAGRTLNQARDAYQVFFNALPRVVTDERIQEDYFLIATLYAVGTHRENPRPTNPPRSLGASLRQVRLQVKDANADRQISLDKRFQALLDADREQLPFRLGQIVRLLATHQIAIDWRRLLQHVRSWNAEDRWVQLAWARDYYTTTSEQSSETNDQASVSIQATTSTKE